MTKIFPVTHSILSVEALITDLLPNYDIETPIDCRFLQLGLNDTFIVNTHAAKYILRVYRCDWRSLADINYELEALLHLQQSGIAVSVPIVRKDGNLIGSVLAPEGLRYVVLFTYALGKQPDYETEQGIHRSKRSERSRYSSNTIFCANSTFLANRYPR